MELMLDAVSFFVSFSTGVVLTFLCMRSVGYSSRWPSGLFRVKGRQARALLAHRNEPLKMTLVVRKDLRMGTGKIAAQCAHAAVAVTEKVERRRQQKGTAIPTSKTVAAEGLDEDETTTHWDEWVEWYDAWMFSGSTKIVLQCSSEEKLMEACREAKQVGLPHTVVRDAGRTQIAPGSKTVLAVGPAPVKLVDRVTGCFKLL
ncbi:peptidyl-tRNA hydrolase, PTH2 family [Trypanosoma rangeli]|uniref:peptidyl-tRNA hydrolase n=1 Tax=Trypanosoma rangeli TaxID=5698 RepID=A0A3R7N0D9_TRYRA|nr:peptidyl-tRNA hydrolase, PTH2 family [Trypanosoma rangeli]RNF10812.1 peptidyl-tRNA hydrolase, PTH2 family [Trypanosoma rangeli]|eukprot:RNF10812.1 peptidyl-tRNA hydrolase, PTH2 family [Trypanosoma rangeli]